MIVYLAEKGPDYNQSILIGIYDNINKCMADIHIIISKSVSPLNYGRDIYITSVELNSSDINKMSYSHYNTFRE